MISFPAHHLPKKPVPDFSQQADQQQHPLRVPARHSNSPVVLAQTPWLPELALRMPLSPEGTPIQPLSPPYDTEAVRGWRGTNSQKHQHSNRTKALPNPPDVNALETPLLGGSDPSTWGLAKCGRSPKKYAAWPQQHVTRDATGVTRYATGVTGATWRDA